MSTEDILYNVERRLSQCSALGKGYQVDSQYGEHPITDVLVDVEAASATKVHAAITLTAAVQTITTAITNPDVFRTLSVTGNQAGVAGNVVITGRDWKGYTIQETIIASGTATVDGNKPFRNVDKIVVPVLVGAGDTISVGVGDKLGFMRPLYDAASGSFKQLERKATAATEYSVEGTAPTVNTTYNTYAPNGGITGDDSFKANYMTEIW